MPTKIRIYELAKELDVPNKDLVNFLKNTLQLEVKSHSSSITEQEANKAKQHYSQKNGGQNGVASPKGTNAPNPKAPPAETKAPETAKPQPQPQKPAQPASKPQPAAQKTTPNAGNSPTGQHQAARKSTINSYTPKQQPNQHRGKAISTPSSTKPKPSDANSALKSGTDKSSAQAAQAQAQAQQEKKSGGGKASRGVEVPEAPTHIVFDHPLTVRELAQALHQRDAEVIKYLFMKGVMITVNTTLDYDAMIDVARHFEVEAEVKKQQDLSDVEVMNVLDRKQEAAEGRETYVTRAPVISIMGHVDHGKTSLLDAIREQRHNIVDTEAGGITQSIGAYTVERDGQKAVFLDTPGHEAFTAMRMRGAKATDIAVLVVAADDGVMPQTVEALNHAKAAGIPIIVAVNKVDKEGADPDRVLSALVEYGVISEKYGGDTITVEVSALQRWGIEDLLENILLLAELLELKADATIPAEGVIIEAKLDKGKGPVASVLVQKGTLKVGQNILMGSVGGRVRALISDSGQRLQEAGPSTPVEILGLTEVPVSGTPMRVIEQHAEFRNLLSTAQDEERSRRLSARTRNAGGLTTSLDDENKKELRVVLKADTHGSLEAALGSLQKLGTSEIQVNVIHTGTGDITEADVMLATASRAIIIAFNSREDTNAAKIAESEGVVIHRFDVIYHMVERVEKLMLGELDADIIEVECGQAEIRDHFTIGKTVVVAGCMVTQGKIVRSGRIEVRRNGRTIHEGYIDALKRFKEEVKEVAQGFECGITLAKFNDHQIGDVIVCFQQEERKRTSLNR